MVKGVIKIEKEDHIRQKMRKIAINLTKGGVGKSVTAVNLSAGLSLMGAKVLLIDADTQGQIASMLGIKPDLGLADLILENTYSDKFIVEARENFWILAGGRALAGIKRMISRKDFGGEKVFSEALSPIEDKFDYVIIDTSPGWDSVTVNVLFYAHEILVPVSLEVLTLQAMVEYHKNLSDIQNYNKNLYTKYYLPTFLDRRVKKSKEIFLQLEEHFKDKLCSPIRYNVTLSEAPGFGQHIFEYSPNSPGARDYNALTKKVSGGV